MMGALWITLGIVWVLTGLAVFMLGRSSVIVPEDPPPPPQPPLPRAGQLDATLTGPGDQDPEPARWWPGLERVSVADTIPLSQVQEANFRASLRRRNRQWMHDQGIPH
jgi:hypothetical protein